MAIKLPRKLHQTRRILMVAALKPLKRGSIEDFVCRLAQKAPSENCRLHVVLDGVIAKEVKSYFDGNQVSYQLISMNGISFYKALLKTIKKYKPQLVHFHFMSFNLLNVFLCRLLGVKNLFFTVHASGSYVPAHPFIEKLKRVKRAVLLKRVDKIIAVSNFVERRLVNSMKLPRDKVITIHNGVDISRFRPFEDPRIMKKIFFGDDTLKVVVFIAQIIPEKGIHILLQAALRVIKNVENVLFVIVGEGKSRADVEDFVRQKRIEEKVKFLGVRSDTELILGASDVLVSPSMWDEAFGLCFAEAMACGLPVVGTKTGGIPEVVREGITGFLVERGDSNALAEAIETILKDEKISSSFGQNGLERARTLFNIDLMTSRYWKAYREHLKTGDEISNKEI